ncbi:hypothetical protein [Streptomyces flavofungini]
MGKFSDFFLGTEEQREHNANFNNGETDPESEDYLASHDRVVAAEKEKRS